MERKITDEKINTKYNNFYEFGSTKYIANEAEALETEGWTIKVDGLVARLDGSKVIRLQKIGELEDADKIGSSLAEALLDNGADAILKDYLK